MVHFGVKIQKPLRNVRISLPYMYRCTSGNIVYYLEVYKQVPNYRPCPGAGTFFAINWKDKCTIDYLTVTKR